MVKHGMTDRRTVSSQYELNPAGGIGLGDKG